MVQSRSEHTENVHRSSKRIEQVSITDTPTARAINAAGTGHHDAATSAHPPGAPESVNWRAGMPDDLTGREREVLQLIAKGKATKEVAFDVGISFRTACCHRWHILTKLAAHNTAELICHAAEKGLVHLGPSHPPITGQERMDPGTGSPREPLVGRLDSILEENRQCRQALCGSIARSHSIWHEVRERWEQLRAAVENSREICNGMIGDSVKESR